jgi:hypothetical protein
MFSNIRQQFFIIQNDTQTYVGRTKHIGRSHAACKLRTPGLEDDYEQRIQESSQEKAIGKKKVFAIKCNEVMKFQ